MGLIELKSICEYYDKTELDGQISETDSLVDNVSDKKDDYMRVPDDIPDFPIFEQSMVLIDKVSECLERIGMNPEKQENRIGVVAKGEKSQYKGVACCHEKNLVIEMILQICIDDKRKKDSRDLYELLNSVNRDIHYGKVYESFGKDVFYVDCLRIPEMGIEFDLCLTQFIKHCICSADRIYYRLDLDGFIKE